MYTGTEALVGHSLGFDYEEFSRQGDNTATVIAPAVGAIVVLLAAG